MSNSLLERVLAADGVMLERLGIELVSATKEGVTLRGRPHSDLHNSFGIVHGSHAFALMDTAAAYALAAREIHAATIGSHMTLARPVTADVEVMAHAQVMTAGRTLATVRAEVTVDKKLAGLATFQFAVRDTPM